MRFRPLRPLLPRASADRLRSFTAPAAGGRPLRPRSRRSALAVGPVVAILVLFAASCGQQLQPTSFDETYKKNFMFGCHEQTNDHGPQASEDFCRCVYKGIVDKVGFDDAKKFEEQQAKEDAGKIQVPKNIQAVIDGCAKTR